MNLGGGLHAESAVFRLHFLAVREVCHSVRKAIVAPAKGVAASPVTAATRAALGSGSGQLIGVTWSIRERTPPVSGVCIPIIGDARAAPRC